MPPTDVEELKDIFREHGDSNSLAMRDVPANTELSQVMCLLFDNLQALLRRATGHRSEPQKWLGSQQRNRKSTGNRCNIKVTWATITTKITTIMVIITIIMIIYENDNLNDISNNKNSCNEIMMMIMPRSIRTFKPPLPPFGNPRAFDFRLCLGCGELNLAWVGWRILWTSGVHSARQQKYKLL